MKGSGGAPFPTSAPPMSVAVPPAEPMTSARQAGPDMSKALETARAVAARLQREAAPTTTAAASAAAASEPTRGGTTKRQRRSRWGTAPSQPEGNAAARDGDGIEGPMTEKRARHGEKEDVADDDQVDLGFLERQLQDAKRFTRPKVGPQGAKWLLSSADA
eukprot:scaffold1199_cov265-Pinguiococcus_pyrenoidosus.AAC.42